MHKQYVKSVREKSYDAHSLSIRVQTTINHISILTFLCFTKVSTSKRVLFSERELKKALRDKWTQAALLGPSNF